MATDRWTGESDDPRIILTYGRVVYGRTGDVIIRYGYHDIHIGSTYSKKLREWYGQTGTRENGKRDTVGPFRTRREAAQALFTLALQRLDELKSGIGRP